MHIEPNVNKNYFLNHRINWYSNNCQPNFRINVSPDPTSNCGPYTPIDSDKIKNEKQRYNKNVDKNNHDTIGMIAIDTKGNIAAGTSTNGASHKIPGYDS